MNPRIVRTLAGKEFARLMRNRGAVTMAVLLCAAALLVAMIGRGSATAFAGKPLRICSIDYWQDGPWIEHLRRNVPADLSIRFRSQREIPTDRSGVLQYEADEAAIQIRHDGSTVKVWSWHPGDDPAVLVPLENWFWRETARYFHGQAIAAAPPERRAEVERLAPPVMGGDAAQLRQALHRHYRERLLALGFESPPVPEIAVERSSLRAIDLRQAVTIALVYFATFFVCVCLLPSMTCEERERGVLQAQSLTPASPLDLFVGKLVVFVPAAWGLAWLVGGLSQPAALIEPFFVAVTLIASLGAFGVGILIAGLFRTQRAASLAAMGYALGVALIVFGAQRSGLIAFCQPLLEYHLPPLLRAALDGTANAIHWHAVGIASAIGATWVLIAAGVVGLRGWKP